jgi:hypothetical protein
MSIMNGEAPEVQPNDPRVGDASVRKYVFGSNCKPVNSVSQCDPAVQQPKASVRFTAAIWSARVVPGPMSVVR